MEMWERLIQAAEAELEKGETENTKSIVEPFLISENKKCRLQAMDIMSRAFLREKEFTKAADLLESLTHEAPTVLNYMTLMAAYQHSKNLQGVKLVFEKAFALSEQQKGSEYSPVNILFYYLDALLYLEDYATAGQITDEITIVYRSLKTLDSETLFVAGIPFYNDFIALVSKYFGQQNQEKEFQDWLKAQLQWVDEEGKAQIQNYLRDELH